MVTEFNQRSPKIIELEQHVADLIAAGEVVERPASVVKELVENSIDAGAGIITVEIASGGMTYIRVTDNGCGIAASDVKTAFLRHATSKLRDAQGLEAIGTLGFRGEALAAIAAVSRVELMTREAGAAEGVSLALEAGEVTDMSPAGCPEGTTIIVRDLFFNTPARLKFMKSDRAEGAGVAAVVLRCALSRPDVSIRFIKDGKTEYHTPGDSQVNSCIYSLLGREADAGFISVESSDGSITVKGFVSSPSASRGNRSYQFFFVNGRAIRSLMLQSALEQAYKSTLPSGRFPSCVLYITAGLGNVDVNVHPSKTEVKFASDKQVFDGVYYAALGVIDKTKADDKDEPGGFKTMQADEYRSSFVSEPPVKYKSSGRSARNEMPAGMPDIPGILKSSNPAVKPAASSSGYPGGKSGLPDSDSELRSSGSYSLIPDPYRVIGEVLNMYIIVEYSDIIYFIDKHAAHERLHFDALMSDDYEPMSESLITPVICRLGHEDASLLLENAALLDRLGFSVESFGEDAVAIRHIPAEIDIGDTEPVLSELCLQLRQRGTAEPIHRSNFIKTIACKAAIKAGRASGSRELETIAARVMSGEVSHCPHGRPVVFEISKATLDKGFGRI